MRAEPGDQLVVESPATGAAGRDGEIVGVRHADGTPPYEVRWSDTDEVTLVCPGPDAHVRGPGHPPRGEAESGRSRTDRTGERASAEPHATTQVRPPHPGDIGRRVSAERRRRGLSREETAHRAGMAPEYLAYLEEQAADPTATCLARLAGVLGTTPVALRGGGGIDRPPGQGQALRHPRIRDLGPDECRRLLSASGVGRVAVSTPQGPAVVPVNYEVVDESIAYRTVPDSAPAAAVGSEVAFEVDHLDEDMGQGWSVLVVGPARVVTDPGAVRRLAEGAHSAPWAGGEREMWVSIRPRRITGRRVTEDGQ
ncbi:pyridoxamine 5'-phosphate oxidase family protein [Streptomyces sp. CMB-StM0423]|uniref:pyridoxamine 5'-phosphate oxidase family protein n=1 Tax=Streptomyces sp. CMB-StM0423 TaxID=2059884 RepID=UPI0018FED6EB|nr:pyridoxamine 5'-phosphate oxidase family protein [Streptomyces sp. CMB-StM0423]